jgi:hypothetical protein
MANEYVPGVCNIGPAERRKRRASGIAAGIVTLLVLAFLLLIDAPFGWRFILIIPAAGAASGFLQDAMHFCAGFGMKGIYNVINSAGITDNVDMEEFRQADRRKAIQILLYSLAIGFLFTALALLIP